MSQLDDLLKRVNELETAIASLPCTAPYGNCGASGRCVTCALQEDMLGEHDDSDDNDYYVTIRSAPVEVGT